MVRLVQEKPHVPGSRVVGAILRRGASNNESPTYIEVTAKRVVLATGGFQGSPDLTSKYIGPGSDNIFVRSNKGSVGDGISLASSVGAGTSRGLGTYYGHLLAAPLRRDDVTPQDFLPLAQYREFKQPPGRLAGLTFLKESRHCLLINEAGRRFADETLGDEVVNQYLAKQENRRGFLLFE